MFGKTFQVLYDDAKMNGKSLWEKKTEQFTVKVGIR